MWRRRKRQAIHGRKKLREKILEKTFYRVYDELVTTEEPRKTAVELMEEKYFYLQEKVLEFEKKAKTYLWDSDWGFD